MREHLWPGQSAAHAPVYKSRGGCPTLDRLRSEEVIFHRLDAVRKPLDSPQSQREVLQDQSPRHFWVPFLEACQFLAGPAADVDEENGCVSSQVTKPSHRREDVKPLR